ncbi:hypothetical protein [Sphingomonas sp. HMP6]|uniref:hypothetical protein n=1 Tax=Sphingomonas sp. HMP6 TaxID=1517551 RepID=UPI0015964971|nr:hypothetical protein [Sphingomonas sp. HMP6]BCA57872.1 hypothetical protein HMP06_0641 [Sphingomonas sp. HMP6]
MKIAALLSAGLIAAAALLPASASAQMNQRHDRVVERSRTVYTVRDRYRPHTRRVCTVKYRHHKRIRTCRTVRR